ncbi:hypothetical protein CAPTEDRAFT_204805 [Capitella teleta]|uniref:Uncharacterized protein n=1 Tax=Capitella teleta TaxID=283909 RepID=R7URI8_CAPTE|nr:hypothetical protein CAPTEDRAFT_204805 [Capitella teleta]|eukprot:ELU06016.1 hypothetical protein CAPTEDRAFT_204805 [Capitella teleta]
MGGGDEVSTIMLYIIVALIGAEVNLSAITKAPLYILSGFMILTIHGVLLLLLGRLLKLNLHICGIASIANIGSAPSAAVVAAAYDKNLMPIAIIMALIGSMIGSFVGLLEQTGTSTSTPVFNLAVKRPFYWKEKAISPLVYVQDWQE